MDREAIVEYRVRSEDTRCICSRLSSRSHGRVVTHFVRKDKLVVETLPVVFVTGRICVTSVTFEGWNVCAVAAQELKTLLRVHL